jgi:hypothetical protein
VVNFKIFSQRKRGRSHTPTPWRRTWYQCTYWSTQHWIHKECWGFSRVLSRIAGVPTFSSTKSLFHGQNHSSVNSQYRPQIQVKNLAKLCTPTYENVHAFNTRDRLAPGNSVIVPAFINICLWDRSRNDISQAAKIGRLGIYWLFFTADIVRLGAKRLNS